MNPLPRLSSRSSIRVDLKLIADMIEPNSRVLDVGCGDGQLLAYLARYKQVDGRGIELSMDGVNECVSHGLPAIQGDADTDLADYPEDAFDFVVLSQTLQATRRPRAVLEDLVRIGRRAIVSFPNFGYWKIRWRLFLSGRMPVTNTLPDTWYNTPNIHLCTMLDFVSLCEEIGVVIERGIALDGRGQPIGFAATGGLANLMAQQAVFLLRRT